MEPFITYALKVVLVSGIFWLVYLILLSRETYFTLNRIVLLIFIFCSFIIPLLPINVIANTFTIKIPEIIISGNNTLSETKPSLFIKWYLLVPSVISSILFFRLLVQVFRLIYMGKSGMQVKKHKIVSNDKITGPYSFFHYIFIPSNLNDTTDLQIILAHEHAHSSQYHSIDKLISELFVAIFWFNPFAWLLHKSITEAHEFLADRYVLKTSCRTDEYLAVLYHQLLPVKISGPVIGFSKSLTFKRFQMITKQNSHTIALLKYAVIIPVMGFALTLAQSSSITAQQKTLISNDSLLMSSEQAPVFSEGSFQTFISKNIKYPKQSIKNKSHGYVIVQFVVNKEGKIENVLVTRNTSNDPLLANEVIRVVKSSPAWKPEINQGKAINLQLTMPVRFNL